MGRYSTFKKGGVHPADKKELAKNAIKNCPGLWNYRVSLRNFQYSAFFPMRRIWND